jgi:hypothetical protein
VVVLVVTVVLVVLVWCDVMWLECPWFAAFYVHASLLADTGVSTVAYSQPNNNNCISRLRPPGRKLQAPEFRELL